MKKLAEQLGIYQHYHQKRATKISHFIGVPCLMFAVLIFLGWIHVSMPNIFSINLAWCGIVALLIYYYYLDISLAATMTIILILFALLADFFSQPVVTEFGFVTFLFFLIVGVVAQLIGHGFEKKKPAFLDNFSQVLIAPLFLVAEILFELGYRKALQAEIIRRAEFQ